MFRYDGQSGGVTPGPIPNPAVKPARVPVCTVLRKRTGTQARCQPLFHFYYVAERLFKHPSFGKPSGYTVDDPLTVTGRTCSQNNSLTFQGRYLTLHSPLRYVQESAKTKGRYAWIGFYSGKNAPAKIALWNGL